MSFEENTTSYTCLLHVLENLPTRRVYLLQISTLKPGILQPQTLLRAESATYLNNYLKNNNLFEKIFRALYLLIEALAMLVMLLIFPIKVSFNYIN